MIRRTSGFTIIEVVLFLAISGLMAIGLLAGTSMAIQRQQYRDAVQSFAGYLRDEYARVVSVDLPYNTTIDTVADGYDSAHYEYIWDRVFLLDVQQLKTVNDNLNGYHTATNRNSRTLHNGILHLLYIYGSRQNKKHCFLNR
jgi:type II secretory pathway pseudopilin PulG